MAGEGGDRVQGNLYDMSGDFRGAQVFAGSPVYLEPPPPPPYDPPPPPDPAGPLPEPGDLPPASLVPYGRNPLFTGRERELRELAAMLLQTTDDRRQTTAGKGETTDDRPRTTADALPVVRGLSSVVLSGLGGVGKTQLAVEFAHRYGRFFQSVHWVSLADAAAVPSAVAECGRRMGLHPAFGGLPLPDQVALTEGAWAGPERRLLIFDNCEDLALLERWRAKSGGARVLVTSRVGRWRIPGVIIQSLDVLSEGEAVALLERHVPRPPQSAHPQMRAPRRQMDALLPPSASEDADSDWDGTLKAIAGELGYLALALHLAGSYLAYLLDTLGGDPAARAADLLARLRDPALLEHASLTGEGAGLSPTDHIQHVGRTFALRTYPKKAK